MVDEEIRTMLNDICDNSIVYDDPAFDKSIIGTTESGSIVYSYENMIKEYMEDNNCSEEDAIEFIDYNTLQARIDTDAEFPTVVFPIF